MWESRSCLRASRCVAMGQRAAEGGCGSSIAGAHGCYLAVDERAEDEEGQPEPGGAQLCKRGVDHSGGEVVHVGDLRGVWGVKVVVVSIIIVILLLLLPLLLSSSTMIIIIRSSSIPPPLGVAAANDDGW